MNPADDEINLFLPLAFGLVIVFFAAMFGIVIWILNKTEVINLAKESHLFSVLRAAVLSVIGVFVISFVGGIAILISQIIKSFFTK